MEWLTDKDRETFRRMRSGPQRAYGRLRPGADRRDQADGPPADEMLPPALVVDFGTSTSSAALVVGDETRMLVEPAGDGSWSWPSVVFLDRDELLVGTLADRAKRADPACFRAEFKRDLGDRAPIQLGDKRFRPEELVTELLLAFRAEGERSLQGRLDRLVLTIPASYPESDPRRDLMIAAGEQAGFAEVELLPEPVAAAFAPLDGPPFGRGDQVLVYDFGGGTFDAALVRFGNGNEYAVVGSASLGDCGGRDMDGVLARHLRDAGVAGAGPDAAPAVARQARLELLDVVRRLKHQLTTRIDARDVLGPAGTPVILERSRFAELTFPIVDRTIGCCRGLLEQTTKSPKAVTSVLLVGGTSRIPLVADAVAGAFGRPVRRPDDPSTAVTRGAARWASFAGSRAGAALPPGRREMPLRWDVPGGGARLVRWLLMPGQSYPEHSALAVVRLGDGSLWRLVDEHAGTFGGARPQPGDLVVSGDWVGTTWRRSPAEPE